MSTDNSDGLTLDVAQERGTDVPDSPEADGRRETQARPATPLHPHKKYLSGSHQSSSNQQDGLNAAAVLGGYADRIATLEAAVEQLSKAYIAHLELIPVIHGRLDGIEAYLAMRAQQEAAAVGVAPGIPIQ